MIKVSMVVPVYNEVKLLPQFIKEVGWVDELIFVDGGAYGSSTDGTLDIIKDYKYITGTYGIAGIWDKNEQINAGIELATKDLIIYTPVDYTFSKSLDVTNINLDETPLIFVQDYQLWLDQEHIRKDHISTRLWGIAAYMRPHFHGVLQFLYKDEVTSTYLSDVNCYHLGWIRPFAEQIEKHKRNIKNGLWGDLGLKIMNRGFRAMEAWCIYHALNYPKISSYKYQNRLNISVMSYLDGIKEFMNEYEHKNHEEFYLGVMRYVPHDLI